MGEQAADFTFWASRVAFGELAQVLAGYID
jgi:hypothetical protein